MNTFAQIIEYIPEKNDDMLTLQAKIKVDKNEASIVNYYATIIGKAKNIHTGEVHIINYDEIQFSTAYIS